MQTQACDGWRSSRSALAITSSVAPVSARIASHRLVCREGEDEEDGLHGEREDDVELDDAHGAAPKMDGVGDFAQIVIHQRHVGGFDGGVAAGARPSRCRRWRAASAGASFTPSPIMPTCV